MIAWLPWHACLGLSLASAGLVALMRRDCDVRGFVFYDPGPDAYQRFLEILITRNSHA